MVLNLSIPDIGDPLEVVLNDVTLREGDQAPLTSLNAKEKQIIALMLHEMGIKHIEVGFGASRADYENIIGIKEMFLKEERDKMPIIASLGRLTGLDTDASLQVLKGYPKPRIHIFGACSDDHIEVKFESKGDTLEERRSWLLEQIKDQVGTAKVYQDTYNKDLEIEFSPEDATGNALIGKENGKKYLAFQGEEFKFLLKSIETAVRAGATIINVPDTLGNLLPHETELFFKQLEGALHSLRNKGYKFELSCHIHNDLGMAAASAIGALRGGATQIELTINGIGERAGNTSLHEIIGNIKNKGHAILEDGREVIIPNIQTELIGPISRFVRRIINLNKDRQTPFIGSLSDIDGSGVHNAAQGVYGGSKNKKDFGGDSIEEFFSARGGVNQVVSMLRKKYGVRTQKTSNLIQSVTQRACEKSEEVKSFYGSNLYALYLQESRQAQIDSINIQGNNIKCILTIQDKEVVLEGQGSKENGYIDGLIGAINKYLGEEKINITGIKIENKPSLHDAIERFENEVRKTSLELSQFFQTQIDHILNGDDEDIQKSKQIGIAHLVLQIGDQEIRSSVASHNVDEATVRAILEGVLPEFMKK